MISVTVWLAAWLRRSVLINWFQDLYPEVVSELQMGRRVRPLLRGLAALRDLVLRSAYANVAIGELMAVQLRRRANRSADVTVIQNWADPDCISPVEHRENALRDAWGVRDKFVLAYSGNIGRGHEFATLLRAAKLLEEDDRVRFLVVGDGGQASQVRELVRRDGLRNVIFQPYQPRERLRWSLGVADLHVVTLLPCLEGIVVPSKFYGVLAAGRGVVFVGAKNGEIPRLIAKHQCGYVFGSGDAEGLAALVTKLAGSPALVRSLGAAAALASKDFLHASICLQRWEVVIGRAVGYAYAREQAEHFLSETENSP